jgi:hypothetical protein
MLRQKRRIAEDLFHRLHHIQAGTPGQKIGQTHAAGGAVPALICCTDFLTQFLPAVLTGQKLAACFDLLTQAVFGAGGFFWQVQATGLRPGGRQVGRKGAFEGGGIPPCRSQFAEQSGACKRGFDHGALLLLGNGYWITCYPTNVAPLSGGKKAARRSFRAETAEGLTAIGSDMETTVRWLTDCA